MENVRTKNIAIFASGSGTNAEQIVKHFRGSQKGRVTLILSNKPDAYVLERARKYAIPTYVFTRDEFYHSRRVIERLEQEETDLIVLAGFLWLVPTDLIRAFPDRMINIHPALLPKYGGKGMYGMRVHEAVIEAGDVESGITIHYVNERYDEGKIIHQSRCRVTAEDTPETLAEKVHQLEYEYFPKVIEELIINK